MPKTAKTRRAPKNSNALTADELKTITGVLDAVTETYYSSDTILDRRYRKIMERIKGKLRDGFAGATRRGF